MTLEQTPGEQILVSAKLFDPAISGLTGQQAAAVWDVASGRFVEGASGEAHSFTTGTKKMNKWGQLRTWWRKEKPFLLKSPRITRVVPMKKDGTEAKIGGCK
jgi:hypothetical protein